MSSLHLLNYHKNVRHSQQVVFKDIHHNIQVPTLKMTPKCFNCNVKGVILDISGVLKECGPNGGVAISGSVDAIRRLKASSLQVRFCTNETTDTRSSLVKSLHKLGFDIEEKNVFAPVPAMCKILKEKNQRPHLLVHPASLPDFDGISIGQGDPNCVVVGDAMETFSYKNVNNAFRCLIKMEKPLLYSLGRGKYYREDGNLTLDVGAYMTALEYATGVKAEIVGKPSKSFFDTVLKDMGLSATETIMVGDDILNDVGGAQECGMWGVQVRTGKFQPSDEQHASVKPDAYVDNLAQFVDLLLTNLSQ